MTDLVDWATWRPESLVSRGPDGLAAEAQRVALAHYWNGWTLLACRAAVLNRLQVILRDIGVGKRRLNEADAQHAAFLNGTDPSTERGKEWRADTPDKRWRAFALRLLDDEIASIGAYHAESVKLARSAALDVLKAGGSRKAVAEAAVAVARGRTPPTPPWMVEEAIEAAAREFRFAGRFWRSRERAG